ncbi:MAG: molybdenum cofactor biosynthesis protein MoaE [Cyanobacteria bacterium REEB65]|nr:molybdenum cofactor biosynthesis protein MoaE [Cyanobacteria bacterium REEB65]
MVTQAIDVAAVLQYLDGPHAGGRVVFEGCVRDHHDGRPVVGLEYEAYEPMALEQLQAIALQARRQWPLLKVAIVHRVGKLAIGDIAVVVGVSGGHRAEAFDGCRYCIDAVKADVPIWKREAYADGSAQWLDNRC